MSFRNLFDADLIKVFTETSKLVDYLNLNYISPSKSILPLLKTLSVQETFTKIFIMAMLY